MRTRGLNVHETFLDVIRVRTLQKIVAGLQKSVGKGEAERVLFIVDDNNYYRSMRQEYHRLARDAKAGFCQLHVAMTAEQAIR